MFIYSLFVTFILSLVHLNVVVSYDPSSYLCSICINSIDALRKIDFTSNKEGNSLYDGCTMRFSKDACDLFFLEGNMMKSSNLNQYDASLSSRDICGDMKICPKEESWQSFVSDSNDYDIRVSKALGSRGYDKVRISVISNSTIKSDIFDYSSPFQYKWTNKVLNTGVVSVTPGQKTTVAIDASHSVDIMIPTEGTGIRGVIIADPCFQSQWIKCVYQDKFQMFDHLTELLNTINAHDDVNFWQILGDNFYDQTGDASSTFFQALSQETKSKVFQTVPGNHDYWVNGSPTLHVPKDQLANGFMQFYGQDVIASKDTVSMPYDFSIDPSDSKLWSSAIPAASNFFFYNQVGNVGFMGYSGANSYDDHVNYFNEACTWASQSSSMDVFLILGHWNSDGMGCDADITVPALYGELLALPACQPVASKMKYFMGHKHCNEVTMTDIGFMVGAQGMSDSSCTGTFGIPVVDTYDGNFNVYYFPITEVNSFDNYDKILSCFKANGVSGCYDLATLWSSTPLSK